MTKPKAIETLIEEVPVIERTPVPGLEVYYRQGGQSWEISRTIDGKRAGAVNPKASPDQVLLWLILQELKSLSESAPKE